MQKYMWVWLCCSWLAAGNLVYFPAADGLEVSAEVSLIDAPDAPFLVLCHQAGWSRGEYVSTTAWFNGLGYHVLAVDQRSGKSVNGIDNLTAQRAEAQAKGTTYLDAKQDIEAALEFVQKTYQPKKLVLLGSSYSASLALRIAGENRYPLAGVLAFSPGEYFGEGSTYVQERAGEIRCLVLITSAAKEHVRWAALARAIPKEYLNAFVPSEDGEHGSRGLWEGKSGWQMYRRATQAFLARLRE